MSSDTRPTRPSLSANSSGSSDRATFADTEAPCYRQSTLLPVTKKDIEIGWPCFSSYADEGVQLYLVV